DFKVRPVEIATEGKPLPRAQKARRLGLPAIDLGAGADFAAEVVDDRAAVAVLDDAVPALVSAVEVEAAIGTEDAGMDAVIVIHAAESGEEHFGLADRVIARFIDRV